MPRVPMPEGPQFQPGGNAPQGRLAAPEASDIGQRQVMALGGAMQEFGASVGGIARDMQAQADELRITDALNQYKERALTLQHDKDAGYLRVRGKDTFDRPDGKSLTEFYGGQLANAAGDIAGTLGNDRQRAAFMKHASNILTTFRGGVQEHEAREYQTYQLSVAEGVQSTALRDIELNWNNPQAVDAAVQRIQAEVYRTAQLTGKSAEWQEAQARKMTSNAHKVGLMAALDQGDVAYADDYLKRYSKQMDGDDILSVKGRITKAADEQVGASVATEYVSRAVPRMSPSDFDRVVGITIQTESGGNPNAVSPVGARGLMQVMPETAKAPGSGIKPSDGSQADDVRVGRELLAAHIKRYGGDLGKAWAAYNAGQGWVDAAVSLADKAQPGTKEADWFWQLTYGDVKLNGKSRSEANRKQTQDYVTKNMAAFESGGGAGAKPTFADVDAGLRADPRLANNPARYKVARQEAERQFKQNEDAIKQQGEETYGQVLQGLIANGGDFKALPPALTSALAQQNPAKWDDAMRFAEGLGKGKQATTDWSLYYDLMRDPDMLGKANLAAMQDKLAPAEFKQLVALQSKAGEGNAESLSQIQGPMAVVTQMAREVGIDTSGKSKSDAARMGRLTERVQKDVTEAERAKGKKLTPDEMRSVVAKSFVQVTVDRPWWFDKTKSAFELEPGDKVTAVKVPASERVKIEAALKKAGRPATDDNIQALYRRSTGLQ